MASWKYYSGGSWKNMANAQVYVNGVWESLSPEEKIDAFTTTGSHTWTNPGVSEVEVLVVGGGGGGGSFGGGGGGGGVVHHPNFDVSGQSNCTITVGDGGLGKDTQDQIPGESGEDSSFDSLVAVGGGGGGTREGGNDYSGTPGRDGGSGGGGSHSNDGSPNGGGVSIQSSYTGATVYGNPGGEGKNDTSGADPDHCGAGGGGATQAGSDFQPSSPRGGGYGGDGVDMSAAFGTDYGENGYFAGGGGGMTYQNTDYQAPGGIGGGGAGSRANPDASAENGSVNTGGGGGSGNNSGNADPISGDGGSGIVLVRYYI